MGARRKPREDGVGAGEEGRGGGEAAPVRGVAARRGISTDANYLSTTIGGEALGPGKGGAVIPTHFCSPGFSATVRGSE